MIVVLVEVSNTLIIASPYYTIIINVIKVIAKEMIDLYHTVLLQELVETTTYQCQSYYQAIQTRTVNTLLPTCSKRLSTEALLSLSYGFQTLGLV